MASQDILARLLGGDLASCATSSVHEFWRAAIAARAPFERPVDAAAAGGFIADRIGFAFLSGYQSAVHVAAAGVAADEMISLCATEGDGAHPRSIHTKLSRRPDGSACLHGAKRLITAATHASELLIVASTGVDDSGRNRLRVARIPARRGGVTVSEMEPAPFVPEIPHAVVELHDVTVQESELLNGDGYDDWLKPFRTVEDVHVHAAFLGYAIGLVRRRRWPTSLLEDAAANLVAIRSLAVSDPRAATGHLALAGVITGTRELAQQIGARWEPAADDPEGMRWARDLPVLSVGERARRLRTQRAWERLASPDA